MEALMARRARKRKNENVTHEDKRFVSLVTDDGKRHSYLNCAVPKGREASPFGGGRETAEPLRPLNEALCQRCGFGYSHLMLNPSKACNECKVEYMAALAAEFEEAGIDLGWGKCQRQHSRQEAANPANTARLHVMRRAKMDTYRDVQRATPKRIEEQDPSFENAVRTIEG